MVEEYSLKIAPGQDLSRVAPLLCAGITTWSPLRHWKAGTGSRVAVVGLGGLGHLAVKLAAALGAEVTLLSHSASKEQDARRLGTHEFVSTSAPGALRKLGGRFDLVLDTVSAEHDLGAYLAGPRLLPHRRPQDPRRLAHRRDRRDAGGPRLLRREAGRRRRRGHPDAGDRRRLRADAPGRRPLPLRHRSRDAVTIPDSRMKVPSRSSRSASRISSAVFMTKGP